MKTLSHATLGLALIFSIGACGGEPPQEEGEFSAATKGVPASDVPRVAPGDENQGDKKGGQAQDGDGAGDQEQKGAMDGSGTQAKAAGDCDGTCDGSGDGEKQGDGDGECAGDGTANQSMENNEGGGGDQNQARDRDCDPDGETCDGDQIQQRQYAE